MTRHAIAHGAREVFLTVGALLGVLCIIATVASFAFGFKPLVFRSGSMSPAIHTGDLAVARTVDVGSLERGDVVSVVDANGNRVTHRLVSMTDRGAAGQLTLKGDANTAADTETYSVQRAERVLFHVPKAGHVVSAAASPAGLFVLGLYVAGMLGLVFRRSSTGPGDPGGGRSGPGERRRGARRAEKSRTSRSVVRAAVVMAAGASLVVASPATAAWLNPATVSGTTFTARKVPAPVVTCGTVARGSVRLNWTAVSGATSYVIHYGTGGSLTETVSATTLSKAYTTAGTSGRFTVEARIAYGSATWASVQSNAKNYAVFLSVVSTCS
ncbi:signal peptidase I [Aeromicrobium sp.]|uniref:signal peptidase I n=1 Tax=Aeromicrobium sp. TaxID=1871063 RepID=UPI0030BB1B35